MKSKKIDNLTYWQVFSSILGILLILSILTKGFIGCPEGGGRQSDDEISKDLEENELEFSEALKNVERVDISITSEDHIKGNANAPITIVEFSDYECSVCRRFFVEVYPKITDNYVEKGKVRYIMKDFPLSIHEYADVAAVASECASEQGKFWEMHDVLFTRNNLDKESLINYAKELNLDIKGFEDCFESGKYYSNVQKDFMDGVGYGVSGTPTFFINGIKLVGLYPFESIQELIDAELENLNEN